MSFTVTWGYCGGSFSIRRLSWEVGYVGGFDGWVIATIVQFVKIVMRVFVPINDFLLVIVDSLIVIVDSLKIVYDFPPVTFPVFL